MMGNNQSIKYVVFLFLVISTYSLYPQQTDTLRVKKKTNLLKAEFDNISFKVFAVDRFGNPKENVIQSFEIHFNLNGSGRNYVCSSAWLEEEMINEIRKTHQSMELSFTEVKALSESGEIIRLPDFKRMFYTEIQKGKKK